METQQTRSVRAMRRIWIWYVYLCYYSYRIIFGWKAKKSKIQIHSNNS